MRILKFGGKSLKDTQSINRIAQYVASQVLNSSSKNRERILVVVSAMGDATSKLIGLSQQVFPSTSDSLAQRELDMLLGSGERVSGALFSLALQKYGCPSLSYTGSQAGVLTQGPYNDAQIKKLKPIRIDETFEKGITPVVAGFQGVDPLTKDVTTLGRGGSDLTALAFAHHYECTAELYKTVGHVHTADPFVLKEAQPLFKVSLELLTELSHWGGKILHEKAAQFAKDHGTSICFYSDQNFQKQTEVISNTDKRNFAVTLKKDKDSYCVSLITEKNLNLNLSQKPDIENHLRKTFLMSTKDEAFSFMKQLHKQALELS